MGSEPWGRVGFRIREDFPRPEPALLKRLAPFASPALSDGMEKFNTMDPGIKPVNADSRILGPAVTLRLRPGDVLVVDTCGCRTNSILGELLATAAFRAGLAGIVIDGGIRDVKELREKAFPVFARFVTPAVGDKDGPGEINYPICCGGVPVHPGDIILGDENGVVVIPPADGEEVIERACQKLAYEEERRKAILQGTIVNPKIDEQLRKKGVIR